MLDELAAIDAATLGDRRARLQISSLSALSVARQRNVLRYAIRQLGLSTPSAMHVQKVIDEVAAARVDAVPVVCWNGVEIRRYRNQLYLLAADKLGVEPRDCLVIEDSPAGLDGAHRAGMKCLGLAHSCPLEQLREADWSALGYKEMDWEAIVAGFSG